MESTKANIMTIDFKKDYRQSVRQLCDVAIVRALTEKIADGASAMDAALSVKYETNTEKIAFDKNCFDEDFFRLSSGVAGEVIQKFVNYGIRAAVFGDFSHYTSKALRDFIHESNKGRHFGFLDSEDAAIAWLTQDGSLFSTYRK